MSKSVLMLTHNCLELTKRAVQSVYAQDVVVDLHIIDNGSNPETRAWIENSPAHATFFPDNAGVSHGWNYGLMYAFEMLRQPYCLVVNNDVVLAPWTYRLLLSYDIPFLTGVATDDLAQVSQPMLPKMESHLEPHPDFSMYLIRKEAWDKIGPFNESMKHYASDTDYHVRGHRLGVPMLKAVVPFYHERSSTMRLASGPERQEINEQANRDRAAFHAIYNCLPGTKDYEDIFK